MSAANTDLEARVHKEEVVILGNLLLNLRNNEMAIAGESIDLTYTEFELLSLLVAQPDHVISYTAILHRLWRSSSAGGRGHLNVLVHRLRSKLTGLQPYELKTVRGRGYGLVRAQ